MRYYKLIMDDEVVAIGTGPGGTEISKEAYEAMLLRIREIASLVDRLCAGQIGIEDVPEDLREEVRKNAEQRLSWQEDAEDEELSAEEALAIIVGGDVSA